MAEVVYQSSADYEKPFVELFQALSLKDQRKALRGACRREASRLKKVAKTKLRATGVGMGTIDDLSKGIRTRLYPARYGLGFLLTIKPRRGGAGFHKNRRYPKTHRELPVLQWLGDGTESKSKSRMTRKYGNRRSHRTGVIASGKYEFMRATEQQEGGTTENNLFNEFQKNVEKAARRKGLL
jgi:hypothetical protein